MQSIVPTILLIAETANSSLQLEHWLNSRGCQCHFATSCRAACKVLAQTKFDLALCHFDLPDHTSYTILERLLGSETTLFFSKLIENGCLCVPTLLCGKRWPASKMLDPTNFAIELEKQLNRLHAQKFDAPDVHRLVSQLILRSWSATPRPSKPPFDSKYLSPPKAG